MTERNLRNQTVSAPEKCHWRSVTWPKWTWRDRRWSGNTI